MTHAVVFSSFDRLNSGDFRFLQEASRLGEVEVLLWSDQAIRSITGQEPRYPQAERAYVIESVRYVKRVQIVDADSGPDALPEAVSSRPAVWVIDQASETHAKRAYCAAHGLAWHIIAARDLAGFPEPVPEPPSGRKKVLVTGCYDFFHSGHVRFFEEMAGLGDLFVVVGNDKNVRMLKGAGHPLLPAAERRFTVGAIRFVKQALVSTGMGWMDAEPEIARLKPDIYAVNEDGDKPEKREFCRTHGLEYVVLKRVPKEGLVRRSSTDLRGF
jgi:cytidyltransferase-like protein